MPLRTTFIFVRILALSVFLSGCNSNKAVEFTQEEKNHFSSLHVGDTIYYESTSHDLDTIVIFRKSGWKGIEWEPDGNLLAFEIKHLPTDKWRIDDTTYQFLFYIHKQPSFTTTNFSIDYRDFQSVWNPFDTCHTDTLTLNNKKITNYYLIRNKLREYVKDSADIEFLYWTNKEGLTAYKNKGGEIWTKKNMR